MTTGKAIQSGAHLRAARALAGLSQSGLAERCGLHRNAVRYWEGRTGEVDAKAFGVRQMVKALEGQGVHLDDDSGAEGVVTVVWRETGH